MSLHFHELIVFQVIEETRQSRSFVLDVPPALQAEFAYEAGQFLTFEAPWDDFVIRRCYSLSSCPGVDLRPKVTVKRVEGGRMSNWMIDTLREGARVRVSPPDGRFVLDAAAGDRPLTLYAGGSGITPIVSLLKSALTSSRRPVRLIYANRHPGDVIFEQELRAWSDEFPGRLEVYQHLDSESGLLSASQLQALLRGRAAGDHYVCGPALFMDSVERALQSAGVAGQRIYFERFNSPVDADRWKEPVPVQNSFTAVPVSFVLRLAGRTHTVPYQRGLTLLAAAQKQQIRAPSSCEDGYCSSCLAQLVTGDVAMRVRTALTDQDIARGRVLLCQALPTSAAHLEVDFDTVSFRAPSAIGAAQAPASVRWATGIFVLLVLGLLLFVKSRT